MRTWLADAALSLGLSVCFCHDACCLRVSAVLAPAPTAIHACSMTSVHNELAPVHIRKNPWQALSARGATTARPEGIADACVYPEHEVFSANAVGPHHRSEARPQLHSTCPYEVAATAHDIAFQWHEGTPSPCLPAQRGRWTPWHCPPGLKTCVGCRCWGRWCIRPAAGSFGPPRHPPAKSHIASVPLTASLSSVWCVRKARTVSRDSQETPA